MVQIVIWEERITLYATAAINGAQEKSPNCQQLYPKQAKNVEWVWTMRKMDQPHIKKKKVKQGHSWKTRSVLRNLGYNTENSCGGDINIVSKGTITREQ